VKTNEFLTAEPAKYLLASIAVILIALALFILVQSIRVVRSRGPV